VCVNAYHCLKSCHNCLWILPTVSLYQHVRKGHATERGDTSTDLPHDCQLIGQLVAHQVGSGFIVCFAVPPVDNGSLVKQI
jgi:hypothetical protein